MHRTSIGTWAYNIGPYAEHPVPFDEVARAWPSSASTAWSSAGSTAIPTPTRSLTRSSARR